VARNRNRNRYRCLPPVAAAGARPVTPSLLTLPPLPQPLWVRAFLVPVVGFTIGVLPIFYLFHLLLKQ